MATCVAGALGRRLGVQVTDTSFCIYFVRRVPGGTTLNAWANKTFPLRFCACIGWCLPIESMIRAVVDNGVGGLGLPRLNCVFMFIK